ncbi:hypothetical protein KUTeg_020905 [Tegillarca granosa]|uniref:Uncharacterized protein n=1 Tax=Tegillarca granosa TaxID=220873 RepID=A0ABQ9EF90_TEGGR|nr:hypothetical protein KUTeg_020905 [Tegillarca granosa]
MEGKIQADGGMTTEEEESETESEWSLAPTDIYISPPDSPGGLSDIDLTLGADVTDYDLQRQMKSTMHLLIKKVKEASSKPKSLFNISAMWRKKLRLLKRRKKRRKHGVYFDDGTPFMSDKDDALSEEEDRFDLPTFGDSPGPTPSITPPSLPSTPVEEEHHEVDVDIALPEEFDTVDTSEEPKETTEEEKPTLIMPAETEVPQEVAAPQEEVRSKYRLSNVKIDVKSLMKQPKAKKGKAEKKEADHAHVGGKEPAAAGQTKEEGGGTSPTLTEEQKKELDKQEMRQRRIEKKQLLRERKLPPRQPRGPKPEQLQMVGMDNKKYEIAPHLKPKPMPLFEPHKPKRPEEQPPLEMPMVKMDDELMEDEMWNQETTENGAVGLMGMKLDLPPARGRGGMLKKPTIQPVKVPTKPPNQIPDVGASPTKELEQPVTPVQQGKMELSISPDFNLEQKEMKTEDKRQAKGKDSDEKQFDEKGRGTPDVETAMQRLRNGGDRYSRTGTPVSSTSQLLQKPEENKTLQKSLSIVLPKEDEEPVQKPEEPPEPQVTDREIVEYLRSMHKHKEEEARKQKQEQREKTLQSLEEKKALKERPSSSFERRKSLEGHEEKVRPFTAHTRYQSELELILELPDNLNDLQELFDDALARYQNLPGNKTTQEQLYHNDGTSFEENWQERAIGRHKLLRMQKELRQRSAALRRQQLQEQQEEKQKMTKLGSRDNIDVLRADSSMYVLSQVERANMTYGGDTFRAESSMWGMSRAPSAIGVIDRSYSVMDRPHTYMGNPIGPAGQPTIKVPDRPKTAMAALQQQQMEKIELKSEKPFSQYILVSRPKDRGPYPMPSPLEEQLLTDRFPNLGMKVYQHHSDLTAKTRRLASSLDYSPYYH